MLGARAENLQRLELPLLVEAREQQRGADMEVPAAQQVLHAGDELPLRFHLRTRRSQSALVAMLTPWG